MSAQTSRITIVDMVWLVACAAMILSAVFVPPNPRGFLGLGALIVGSCTIELVRATKEAADRPSPAERRYVGAVLCSLLVLELGTLAVLMVSRVWLIALWFAGAAALCVMALVAVRLRSPRDLVLLTQLGFHACAGLPSAGVLIWFLWSRAGRLGEWSSAVGIVGVMLAIMAPFWPLVWVCGLFALLLDHGQDQESNTRIWRLILLGQLCWVVILVRPIFTAA